MEAIRTWLDISRSDLESSKLLHANGYYANSYFLFQQSVEKANKAFGLFSGEITEEELKKFSHNQFQIYRKLLVLQRERAQGLVTVLDQNHQIGQSEIIKEFDFNSHNHTLDKEVRFIDSLKDFNLVDIPASELNYLLRELKRFEKQKIKIPKNAKRTVLPKVIDFIGAFPTPEAQASKEVFEKFLSDEKQSDQYWKVIVDSLPSVLDILFVNLILYFCALITIQHSSIARYPDEGDSPLWLYTADLSVVKKQPLFMEYLEKALIKFQNLLK